MDIVDENKGGKLFFFRGARRWGQSLLGMLRLLKDLDPVLRSLPEEEFTTLKESLSTFLSLLVPPSQTRSLLKVKAGEGAQR